MTFFSHDDEEPKPYSKSCHFFCSCLKDAFKFGGKSSRVELDEDYSTDDPEEDRDMVILAIKARAMEAKLNPKSSNSITSVTAGDLFVESKKMQNLETVHGHFKDEGKEEFFDVGSHFSRCSSASKEAYFSVGSCLSRSSSTSKIEPWDFPRRSILEDFSHCDGWPFGLRRKIALLPPLPKCPSESWTWSKGNNKRVKFP
ncbi:hypothetical protein ACHQM5_024036 [Ranunculus cassubicifolius]